MSFNKKFLALIAICFMACSASGYKFPDKMPKWQELQNYKLEQLRIGSTTMNDFVELAPGYKKKILQNYLVILNEDITNDNNYQAIRIGFQYNKLDWIEFTLKQDIQINEFVNLYGKPADVNTTYSSVYDYYDYGFFNVSTDKQHKYAYHITVFELPAMSKALKKYNLYLPDYYSFNFLRVLKPGELLETEFLEKYSGVIPFKKDRFDIKSVYSFSKDQFDNKLYKSASFVFKNGLLNFINLEPVNLKIEDIVRRYGNVYKTEPMGEDKTYYEYPNFILVVESKSKKVLNIGIFSSN